MKLIKPSEAARLIGVTRGAITAAVKRGELHYQSVPGLPATVKLLDEADVLKWDQREKIVSGRPRVIPSS